MRNLLAETSALAGDAFALWRRYFLQLGTWYCLGFALHQLGRQLSATLGGTSQLIATLVFVVGVLAWLAALIMMIYSLKPGLWTPQRLTGTGLSTGRSGTSIPSQVFQDERALDVLITTVGPFLAVYAVWGFVEDEVSDLFFANVSQTSYDLDRWSISFDPERAPFYLILTVAAWLLGKIVGIVTTRFDDRLGKLRAPASILTIMADGTFVFGLFMTLAVLADRFEPWWQSRAVAVWLAELWRGFLDGLPAWPVWFDLTLPQAIRDGVDWIWQSLVPGMADRLLLPLMWLALTATVFGWRQFRGRDVIAGTRLGSAADRIGRMRPAATGAGFLGVAARVATDDLRTKYLPVITALRVLVRTGYAFIGAYLLLSALLWFAESRFGEAVTRAIGPRSEVGTVFVIDAFQELITGLIFTTASVALYAASFDRAIAEVTGAGRREAVSARP